MLFQVIAILSFFCKLSAAKCDCDIKTGWNSWNTCLFTSCAEININGVLTVPDKWTEIKSEQFCDCGGKLKTYHIGNNIKKIGDGAFRGTGLSTLTIPNSVTYIGDNAFLGTQISSVTLPQDMGYVGDNAFGNCPNLKDVTINSKNPNFAKNAFAYMGGTGGTLTATSTPSITFSYRMFIGSKFGTAKISADTTAVFKDEAFYEATFNSLEITATKTASFGTQSFAASNPATLTISTGAATFSSSSFTNSKFGTAKISADTTAVFNVRAFYEATFNSLEITAIKTASFGTRSFAASNPASLTISTGAATFSSLSFNTAGMTTATISADTATFENYTFAHTSKLTSVTINVRNKITLYDQVFLGSGKGIGSSFTMEAAQVVSEFKQQGSTIQQYGNPFYQTYFESISIKAADSIQLGQRAFESARYLESVSLIAQNSIRLDEWAFANGPKLKTATFDTKKIYFETNTFINCENLENFIMSSSVESLDVSSTDDRTFLGCSKLKSFPLFRSITSELGMATDVSHYVCLKQDNGGTHCQCMSGYGNSLTSPQSEKFFQCYRCPAGKSSRNPQPYLDSAVAKNGGDKCFACGAGTYSSNGDCTKCPAGRYGVESGATQESQCTDCPAGKYSVAGSTECTVCPIGTSCPDVGMTIGTSCAKGRYGDREGVTECTECQAGRYTDKVGQIACRGCSTGKYSASNGSDSESGCVNCAKGKYSYFPASAGCAECPKNTYTDVVGKSTCTECPIGKTTIGATETATGASYCNKTSEPCRPGQMRHENGPCTNCTMGYHSTFGEKCWPCDAGKFNSLTGQPYCQDCPRGSAGSGKTASVSEGIGCIVCAPGKYGPRKGAEACNDCHAGAYCPRAGLANATECPKGRYSNKKGSKECQPCQAGRYQDQTGSAICELCPAGRYSNLKNSSFNMETTCAQCWPGKYSGDGAQTCIDCAVDFYADSWNSSVCTKCPEFYATNGKEGQALCQKKAVTCSAGQEIIDSTCRNCTLGTYSINGKKCFQCDSGYFSNSIGAPRCEPCPAGRHGIEGVKGAKSEREACVDCKKGTYNPFTGRTSCQECMPGTECPETGMRTFKECGIGSYQVEKSQERCEPCPSGRYVSHKGAAACDLCPSGTSNPMNGSHDNSSCIACIAGRYASQAGQSECTVCADGQFQREPGMASCQVCTIAFNDPKVTSNADHTGCEENKALANDLLSEMQSEGLDLSLTLCVALGFVAVAALVTHLRKKEEERLANFTVAEALYSSFLPGFSAGAEIFLIIDVWIKNRTLGGIMLLSRLLHLFAGGFLLSVLFGPDYMMRILGYFVKDAWLLHDLFDEEYAREYIYVVETVALLSISDITMLTFLPWKKSRFFQLSEGYPCMGFMKVCLTTKMIQSFVTTACEIYYLDQYDPSKDKTNNTTTQALFYINIIFGVVVCVVDAFVLCMRGKILAKTENETAIFCRKQRARGTITKRSSQMEFFDVYEQEELRGIERLSAIENAIESGEGKDAGPNDNDSDSGDDDGMRYTSNPLHSESSSASAARSTAFALDPRRDTIPTLKIVIPPRRKSPPENSEEARISEEEARISEEEARISEEEAGKVIDGSANGVDHDHESSSSNSSDVELAAVPGCADNADEDPESVESVQSVEAMDNPLHATKDTELEL